MSADRRTQAARSAATRRALLEAGRTLFGRVGYAEVSTVAIVKAAGVSRGAMYHQFADKRSLFEAVLEDVERDLVQRIGSAVLAAGLPDPIDGLVVGCLAWLDASAEPEVQRIALLDAPAVLGWERWREIESRHTIGLMEERLAGAMAAGRIHPQATRPLALVLVGALDEASQHLAKGYESPEAIRSVIVQLISGLARNPDHGGESRSRAPDSGAPGE
ncbi:TetR/AcrR family transcriptional regulator [Streptomyces sp. NPDC004609]|uniref:TetR/AcrR family transcriptional regulator n=1 Tax=Streptomyces sp. NPDC004609 TaxID=3364704 RepID=UPI0036BD85C6